MSSSSIDQRLIIMRNKVQTALMAYINNNSESPMMAALARDPMALSRDPMMAAPSSLSRDSGTLSPLPKIFIQYLNRLALDYPRELNNIKTFKENMEKYKNSEVFKQVSVETFTNSTDENFLNKILMFIVPATNNGDEARLLAIEQRLYEQDYRIERLEKQALIYAVFVEEQETELVRQESKDTGPPNLIPIMEEESKKTSGTVFFYDGPIEDGHLYENEVIQYDMLDDDFIPCDYSVD